MWRSVSWVLLAAVTGQSLVTLGCNDLLGHRNPSREEGRGDTPSQTEPSAPFPVPQPDRGAPPSTTEVPPGSTKDPLADPSKPTGVPPANTPSDMPAPPL